MPAVGRTTLAARIRGAWEDHPLAVVLALAAILRLAAAIWARGYGMYDDHFDVVEVAQRWVDGTVDWAVDLEGLRCLLYPGLHGGLFALLERAGVVEPQSKMVVVRLLHGAWSMLTVLYGYRVAEVLGGRRGARVAGLLLATFWLLPWFSVRNLIEVACQPPLVIAAWLLVRDGPGATRARALWAGAWLGLAFAIRFQTALAAAGIVGWLLLSRRVRDGILVGAGALLSTAVLVGATDWAGYGRPFASLAAYVAFNARPGAAQGYPTGPWHRYLGLIVGILIPPTSLALLWGGLRSWRRLGLLFWPTLVFIAVHSAYAGKQERFLFPVLPFLLLLTSLGWLDEQERSPFWRRHPRLVSGLWTWFWAANTLLLALYTVNYGKRSQVEAMSLLRREPGLGVLVVDWLEEEQRLPGFYLGRDVPTVVVGPDEPGAAVRRRLEERQLGRPTHLLLMGEGRREERLARLGDLAAGARLVAVVPPGPVDALLHRMNPRNNVNLTAYLYRLP